MTLMAIAGQLSREEEDHARAAKVLEAIDPQTLPPDMVPLLINNLAWCRALLGDGDEAVALATKALEMAEQAKLPLLPYCLGTLGAAQVLSGRPGDAVSTLERALALGKGDAYAQPIRLFFLGEALDALGRTDEAKQAWQRAIQENPKSPHAGRARERLGTLEVAKPYR